MKILASSSRMGSNHEISKKWYRFQQDQIQENYRLKNSEEKTILEQRLNELQSSFADKMKNSSWFLLMKPEKNSTWQRS